MADLPLNKRLEQWIVRIETVLGVVLFLGMFGAIITQVLFRYVLKNPLVWPYELSIYCFIYIIFLGAGIAARRDTHVVFGMFFDRFSVRTQLIVRIITNCCVMVVLVLVLPSTYSFIKFMGSIRSSALDLPMYIILASFPLGVLLIILYLVLWTITFAHDLRNMGSAQ